uniref:Uncharacterized protein n=1 Tax=Photinus pyralis TaxID=7054 RepID=A0A1Y1K173_PHOPY
MNTLLMPVIVSLSVFLSSAYDQSGLEGRDYECMKKLNLTVDFVVNGFDEYNFLREGDPELNAFLNCTWRKAGYLTTEGQINPDGLKAWLEVDLIQKKPGIKTTAEDLVRPCQSIRGDDPGDTGIKVYNCIVRTLWGV